MSKSSYVDNLRFTRIDILNKLIIAHLNINSIINKFDLLVDKIKENIEILMISETKLDNSFPTIPFLIKGFNYTIRQDRNQSDGGTLLYIRVDKFAKAFSFDILN